jgi:hypothetical protein
MLKTMDEGGFISGKISPYQRNAGKIAMRKSTIILMLSLMMFGALLVSAAIACEGGCGGENWDPTQKLDEIGNPSVQNDAVGSLWGPADARQKDSQFKKNAAKENVNSETATSSNTESDSSAQMSKSGIELRNITASPNPVISGGIINITAVLGENMTANALITNSVGVQVGNVILEHTSEDEYAGTWKASIATGTYNATIVVYASGVSRTFADALQIEVKGSPDNDRSAPGYMKLG